MKGSLLLLLAVAACARPAPPPDYTKHAGYAPAYEPYQREPTEAEKARLELCIPAAPDTSPLYGTCPQ